jgi:hypothetical protein
MTLALKLIALSLLNLRVMNLDLTDEEAAALLLELNGLIDGDHYFLRRASRP